MVSQLIDWSSFPLQFNDKVRTEAEHAAAWLHATHSSGNIISDDELRYHILQKLDYMTASPIPTPGLTRALLILGFYGLLKNPEMITFDDIENAR